jgi:hypothetical protein
MCECENAKALIVEGGKGTNRQRWMSMALVETIKSFEDHVKKVREVLKVNCRKWVKAVRG